MTDTTHSGDRVERPADGADMTHLQGRTARSADAPGDGTVTDHWGGPRIPEHHPRLLDATASEYLRLVAESGARGPAHAYLSRQRQEAPEWLDPWRFIEAVASRLAQKTK